MELRITLLQKTLDLLWAKYLAILAALQNGFDPSLLEELEKTVKLGLAYENALFSLTV
jgi:hypothetical protein